MFWFTLAFFSLVLNVVTDMQTNFIKSQEIVLADTNDWTEKNPQKTTKPNRFESKH